MRFSARSFLTLVVVFGLLSHAEAAPLLVGGTLFPAPSEASEPSAGATLLQSTGAVPFLAVPPVFSGNLVSSVYNNDSSNPFGLNALTFTYLVSSDPTSQNLIARMTLGAFAGFSIDASFAPTGNLPPTFIDRPGANVVGFSFQGPPIGPGALPPGATTALLVVQTNATLYGTVLANVIDGGQANGIPSLGPVIPEPGSMACAAVLLLAGWRRWR